MYAWGITANELLTGAVPWADAQDNDQIRYMVRNGERPALFAATTDAERELMRLVGSTSSGSLAQEPPQRSTAENLCRDLSSLSASLVIRGSSVGAVREMIKPPECPICYEPYSNDRKCYLVCANGHSLCELCKAPSTRGGECPICRGPCPAEGGYVNRGVMDIVDAITLLSSPSVSSGRAAPSISAPPVRTTAPQAGLPIIGELSGLFNVSVLY